MLKDSLCSPSFQERVSPKSLIGLEFQESLKWALAGFAESWACRLWQTQFSTRTQRKENKLKSKNKRVVKRLGGFSSHHGSNWLGVVQSTWRKREFIFPEREREFQEDGAFKEREEKLRES